MHIVYDYNQILDHLNKMLVRGACNDSVVGCMGPVNQKITSPTQKTFKTGPRALIVYIIW